MRKLWLRFSLAFALLLLLAIGVMAVALAVSLDSRFRSYLVQEQTQQALADVPTRLVAHYAETGSWAGVAAVLPGSGGLAGGSGANRDSERGLRITIIGTDGVILYDRDTSLVSQTASDDMMRSAIPVELDGNTIAFVHGVAPGQANLSAAQAMFLADLRRLVVTISLIALLMAVGVGLAFGRWLSAPLARVNQAVAAIAAGELGAQVSPGRSDPQEIEALSLSINQMSAALAESEAQKQRLTADVAHELRTPVAVIRGQLQAMMDGVSAFSLSNIAHAYDQAIHLSRIIEDLRTLTRAESGQLSLVRQPLDIATLLSQTATAFEPLAHDAGFRLVLAVAPDLPALTADPDRLRQVLANLLTNALRYTTAGGEITLHASSSETAVRIGVSNDGVTISDDERARVFERFWRGEGTQQKDGSGLGLPIARQLARLHGGDLWLDLDNGQTHFISEWPL